MRWESEKCVLTCKYPNTLASFSCACVSEWTRQMMENKLKMRWLAEPTAQLPAAPSAQSMRVSMRLVCVWLIYSGYFLISRPMQMRLSRGGWQMSRWKQTALFLHFPCNTFFPFCCWLVFPLGFCCLRPLKHLAPHLLKDPTFDLSTLIWIHLRR